MKKFLFTYFALCIAAIAQTTTQPPRAVTKHPTTSELLDGFKVGSGTTVEFKAGSILTMPDGFIPLAKVAGASDATLTNLAALATAANKGLYWTATDTAALYDLTAGGRALGGVAGTSGTFPYFSATNVVSLATITPEGRQLLDDASVAAMRATLGVPADSSVVKLTGDQTITGYKTFDGNLLSNDIIAGQMTVTGATYLDAGSIYTNGSGGLYVTGDVNIGAGSYVTFTDGANFASISTPFTLGANHEYYLPARSGTFAILDATTGKLELNAIPTEDISIAFQRGTESEVDSVIIAEGVAAWTTDTKRLTIGDGVSQGGYLIRKIEGYAYDEVADQIVIAVPGGAAEPGILLDSSVGYAYLSTDLFQSHMVRGLYMSPDSGIRLVNDGETGVDGLYYDPYAPSWNLNSSSSTAAIYINPGSNELLLGDFNTAVQLTGGDIIIGNIIGGIFADSSLGFRINASSVPTTEAQGLWIGADVAIYRSAADTLRTNDLLYAGGGITATGTVTLPSTTSVGNVSSTELGYVDGVTSSIQTQINGKQASDGALTALAGLTYSANQGIYATGADAFATYSLTAGGRALDGVAGTSGTFPYFSAANVVSLSTISPEARTFMAISSVAGMRSNIGAAADTAVVKLTGDQTVAGVKTFSNDVIATNINGPTAGKVIGLESRILYQDAGAQPMLDWGNATLYGNWIADSITLYGPALTSGDIESGQYPNHLGFSDGGSAGAGSLGLFDNKWFFVGDYQVVLNPQNLTARREYTFPDEAGTIALLDSVTGKLDISAIPTEDIAIAFQRGTESEVDGVVIAEGVPAWATDTKRLTVGDGSTAGGNLIQAIKGYTYTPEMLLDLANVDVANLTSEGVFMFSNGLTPEDVEYTLLTGYFEGVGAGDVFIGGGGVHDNPTASFLRMGANDIQIFTGNGVGLSLDSSGGGLLRVTDTLQLKSPTTIELGDLAWSLGGGVTINTGILTVSALTTDISADVITIASPAGLFLNELASPTTEEEGLHIGDATLYRSATDTLRTNDTLEVATLTLDGGNVPTTASSTGVAGTIRYDANYVYVCIATNTWKRSPLSTW